MRNCFLLFLLLLQSKSQLLSQAAISFNRQVKTLALVLVSAAAAAVATATADKSGPHASASGQTLTDSSCALPFLPALHSFILGKEEFRDS